MRLEPRTLGSLVLAASLVAGCSGSRHVTVFAAPGSMGTFSRTQRDLASAARSIGWQAPLVSRPSVRAVPVNSSVTALLGVRVPVRAITLEAAAQLGSSSVGGYLYNPELGSLVTHTFRASQSYALASIERYGVRVGAGPVLLSTRWHGAEELVDRALPTDVFSERSGSNRIVGAIGQLAFALRGGDPRALVLDFFLQYRVTPSVQSGQVTLFPGAGVTQNALTIGATLGSVF